MSRCCQSQSNPPIKSEGTEKSAEKEIKRSPKETPEVLAAALQLSASLTGEIPVQQAAKKSVRGELEKLRRSLVSYVRER